MARRNFLSGNSELPKPSVLKPVSAMPALPAEPANDGSIGSNGSNSLNAPIEHARLTNGSIAPISQTPLREAKLQAVERSESPAPMLVEPEATTFEPPKRTKTRSPKAEQGRAVVPRKEKYPLHWPIELLETLRDASEFTRRPMNSIAIEAIQRGLRELQREANHDAPFPRRDREPQVGRRCG